MVDPELARPSLRLRAFLAIALLFGFYGLTLTVSLAMLAAGAAFVWAAFRDHINIQMLVLAVICAIPAVLLAYGVVTARPPRFVEPGRRLKRKDAPALFTMLDDLATLTKTAAPKKVYLTPTTDLAVAQTGGFFGIGSKRVLIIGAPVLHLVTIGQLRSGLAHEYGHFVGADTSLSGVYAYTHALFLSVISSTRRSKFDRVPHYAIAAGSYLAAAIGLAITRWYARLFFRVTHSLGRRQEIAADVLSATIVGSKTAVAALETISTGSVLYEVYLREDVLGAVSLGAMPTDLLDGFTRFRKTFEARDVAKTLDAAIRTQKTDALDTHPALRDRVAILTKLSRTVDARTGDDSPATTLLATDLSAWLCDATLKLYDRPITVNGVAPLERMAWQEIPERVFEPSAREKSVELGRRFATMYPNKTVAELFVTIVGALESQGLYDIASVVEPKIRGLQGPNQLNAARRVAFAALATLFQGALLERGARADVSLGAPCIMFRLGDELVPAAKIAADAFQDADARTQMTAWATRLGSTNE